jgi:hypothetical protein
MVRRKRKRNQDKVRCKRKRNQLVVAEYKQSHPCSVCGESRLACLDFHHVTGEKESTINGLVQKSRGVRRLGAEMKKCIVLCANCHRVIHA